MKHLNISLGVFLAFSSSWIFSADYNPQKTDELKQHLSQFEHAKTTPKYIKIEISKPEFSDKIIRLLFDQADPGVKTDVVQSSALHYAAAANNNNLIYFLWKKGVSINVENNNKSTPLIWAASYGNRKAVALLIRLGADVNIEDTSISTPMSNALQVNDLGTVTELLSAGAEVNFDDFKRTMGKAKKILAACFSIQEELLPNETSLHQAIRLNCPDIAGYGVSSYINQGDNNGFTPLNIALIKRSKEDVILSLLVHGANPSAGSINCLKLASRVEDWQISSQSKAKETSVFMVMLGYSNLKEIFLCSPEIPTEIILLVIDFILNHGQIELDPGCTVN